MKTAVLTTGTHIYVAIEGAPYTNGAPGSANLGAGTVDKANKPRNDDVAWIYGGVISLDEIEPSREEREVFAPSPGVQRLFDVIEQRRQLNFTFTFEEITRLNLCLLFSADPGFLVDSQRQFNPLEGRTIRAWVKIQKYDQNDAGWLVLDIWAYLKVNSAVQMGDDIVRPQIQARTLHSALNTGEVAGLLA
jgi:hypothetical protein